MNKLKKMALKVIVFMLMLTWLVFRYLMVLANICAGYCFKP